MMRSTKADAPISARLADFVAALERRDIPESVQLDAGWRLVDTVGVGLAGSRMDFAGAVRDVIAVNGGRSEATVLGFGDRLPASAAGFANASFAHGPDYDDTHSVAMVHIGCLAVPAAMAAAERALATGSEMMVGLVLGAEVGLRIGAAAPHKFHERGYHATGVAGPFVAATATGKILHLEASAIADALGLAGSQSAGLLEGLHDGSWVKRLHPAWSVQAGITAALLAQRGFVGAERVLEGEWGMYAVLLHGDESPADPTMVLDALGETWLLPETTFKPYACGAWNHSSMDAVASIIREERLAPGEVARIDVHVPNECVPLVCEPRDVKVHPQSVYHMKFSLPYSVAMVAVLGHADVDDYTEATLADPNIEALASRVYCHAAPDLRPERFPARVELATVDGRSFKRSVTAQRGGPGNPMSPEDHRNKFRANAMQCLGAPRTEEALRLLENAWELDSLVDLMPLLVTSDRS
jgi:2-methylcitrate dehydratase PrpD